MLGFRDLGGARRGLRPWTIYVMVCSNDLFNQSPCSLVGGCLKLIVVEYCMCEMYHIFRSRGSRRGLHNLQGSMDDHHLKISEDEQSLLSFYALETIAIQDDDYDDSSDEYFDALGIERVRGRERERERERERGREREGGRERGREREREREGEGEGGRERERERERERGRGRGRKRKREREREREREEREKG